LSATMFPLVPGDDSKVELAASVVTPIFDDGKILEVSTSSFLCRSWRAAYTALAPYRTFLGTCSTTGTG
jgi:hypothetical protein